MINRALHRKAETPLPEHALANDFSEFLKEKIKTIGEHFDEPHTVNDNNNTWEVQLMFTTELTDFKPLTED